MVCHRWSRLPAVGLLLILSACSLALATGDDEIVGNKKEVRIRNKRDGSWSDWSQWSPCSRMCGGGIRTQTRQCQIRKGRSKSSEITSTDGRYARNVSSRHCEGHATRHHLCNTQECPMGSIDFRETQCKAFDNRPFMGKVYQWESFIDAVWAERSPCSLTCRAKGYRFFATLNKSVIDGTPCSKGNNVDLHVCIYGTCTAIGCDGIAGSTRRMDLCGVCGGDNSTCRVVSGIFTRPQLNPGLNVVAHIPKGACNLNITEIRKSPNHLTLRKQDGTFVFNGDWKLAYPGSYDAVGTQFQYTRNDLKTFESISSAGPLREPVDLLVYFQQPNPGIKYEYILPMMSDTPIPPAPLQDPPLSRSLRQPLALAATSRPGSYINGPQAQAPSNSYVNNGNQVSVRATGIQQPLPLPQSSQSTNPFNTISSFPVKSLMPPPPSSGGSQLQSVPSSVYPSSDSASSYSNGKYSPPHSQAIGHHHLHNHHGRRRNHGGGGKRQQLAQQAGAAAVGENPDGKKFYWKITGYTNCSEPCGGGTQRSIIRCVRGPVGNPVSDRRCTTEEKPPGQTIRCNLKPCPAEWIVGEWSYCSAECGDGTKTRTIHCQQRISPTLTMRVAEGACLQQRPETRANCLKKSCHHWETSEWSQCSTRCGNGVRKRTVTCIGAKGQRISDCDPSEKPAEITACNMGPCEGVDWFVSDWSSECSQRCGGGIQTRHVICSVLDHPHNSSGKATSSELESNIIDDDDNDHHHRGGRSITSLLGGGADDVPCDESRKPDAERECFSDRNCGEANWFSGPWGDCSVYCGNGMRTRQVLCIIFSRGKFKVITESHCHADTRPKEKEPCESSKICPSRWFSTDWSECSALCGGGTQKRSVSCRASNWTLTSTLCTDKDRPVERRSCNEHKCSLSSSYPTSNKATSTNTDPSGMVKDKPLLQQAAGALITPLDSSQASSVSTSTLPPLASTTISTSSAVGASSRDQIRSSSTNSNVTANNSRGSVLKSNSSSNHQRLLNHHLEPNEEPDESECTDQYRNCALVVQARLCRYKYYRSVCCNSCAEAN